MIKTYIFSKPTYTPNDIHGKLIKKCNLPTILPVGTNICIDGILHKAEKIIYDLDKGIAEIHLDLRNSNHNYPELKYD